MNTHPAPFNLQCAFFYLEAFKAQPEVGLFFQGIIADFVARLSHENRSFIYCLSILNTSHPLTGCCLGSNEISGVTIYTSITPPDDPSVVGVPMLPLTDLQWIAFTTEHCELGLFAQFQNLVEKFRIFLDSIRIDFRVVHPSFETSE